MKKTSLSLILSIRYWSSIIYYFCMLFYGLMIIVLYGVEDINVGYGLLICGSFLVALLCIMVKADALLKNADPLNSNNRNLYIIILLLEGSEIIIAYLIASVLTKGYISVVVYCVYVTLVFVVSKIIHNKIINEYEDIKANQKFDDLLERYLSLIKREEDVDIDGLFKGFISFLIYIICLTFIYKYTLYSWTLTGVFITVNILVMWKLHWTGVKNLIKHRCLYFGVVCFVPTFGIVFLKLIYDGTIYIPVFEGRDAQEYLMALILFFLPLIYYGSKVAVRYINTHYQWTE